MGSCRPWQRSPEPGEGQGSPEGSRGLRKVLSMESRGRSEQNLTFHFRENAIKIGSLEIPPPHHMCLEVSGSPPHAPHLLAGMDFPRHFQETWQKRPLKSIETGR